MALPLEKIVEGKYEIVAKITEGGMGAIYKVRHRLLDEVRVVKVLQPQYTARPDLRRRFRDEARMAIRLRHPNIAQLHDFAMDDEGNAYMVMEYINGVTWQEMLVKSGLPSIPFVVEICQQALKAFGYLHEKGFVHRDIAPDNLMLTRNYDGRPLVKLIDLGIAKGLSEEAGLTRTGMFLGKARYAAPEQFESGQGAMVLDQCSDIYSFGVMSYELLTGRSPIAGENFSALIASHLLRPPLDFAKSDPAGRVPERLREIVMKTLAKAREERISTARELHAMLEEFSDHSKTGREELDSILGQATLLVSEVKFPIQPGSSQSRLDHQFGPEPTPHARSIMASEGDEASRLLTNARLLTRLEQYDKAETELRQLLDLIPEDHKAEELLASLEAARKRKAEEVERIISRAVKAIVGAIDRGELAEAKQKLEKVRSESGDHPRLRELEAPLEQALKGKAERERHQAEIDGGLAEAARLRGEGRLDEAVRSLQSVLELVPDHAGAARLLREIEEARKREQDRQKRERAVKKVLKRVEAHLGNGKLDLAAKALRTAEKKHGADERFVALRVRLEELKIEELAPRIAELLASARDAAARGEHLEASNHLKEVLSLDPQNREAKVLDEEVQAVLRKRFELERREQSMVAALGALDGLLGESRFDQAAAKIEAIERKHGKDERLDAILERIAEGRRKKQEQQVAALLGEARERLDRERPESAIERARKALELEPEHAGARKLLAEAEEALRRGVQAKWRAQALGQAVESVERALSQRDLGTALPALAAAEREFGADERLVTLREKVEEEERRQVREGAEAAVNRGKKLHADNAYDGAVEEFRRALSIDPDNREAQALLAESEAWVRQREARVRQAAVAKTAARIEKLLSRKKLERAARELERAEGQYGDAEALKRARQLLELLRAEVGKTVVLPQQQTSRRPFAKLPKLLPEMSQRTIWLGGAVLVALAVVTTLWMIRPQGPPALPAASGTLVLTALPWAEVTEIRDSRGEPHPLVGDPYTPILLALPPDSYRITLVNPQSAAPIEIEVEIRADEDTLEVVEFDQRMGEDAYFEKIGW